MTMKTPDRYEYGVDYLWTVPFFQTREEYEAKTGKVCPAYDPTKRVKRWLGGPSVGKTYVQFAYFKTSGSAERLEDIMPLSEWLNVNIPPTNAANIPVHPDGEWPVPCRELFPEETIYLGFGGVTLVRNAKFAPAPSQPSDPSAGTSLLLSIDAKLDKILKAFNL